MRSFCFKFNFFCKRILFPRVSLSCSTNLPYLILIESSNLIFTCFDFPANNLFYIWLSSVLRYLPRTFRVCIKQITSWNKGKGVLESFYISSLLHKLIQVFGNQLSNRQLKHRRFCPRNKFICQSMVMQLEVIRLNGHLVQHLGNFCLIIFYS